MTRVVSDVAARQEPFLAVHTPVFLVDDVRAAVDYYVSILGFKQDFLWGDPPVYAGVSRDSVTINFAKPDQTGRLNSAAAAGTTTKADLNITVRGVHKLFRELVAHGAQVTGPPVQQPYGVTNFHADDLNGYCLCFGQATAECDVGLRGQREHDIVNVELTKKS